MNDPATDFLRDYQHFAQQSWDTWMRQLSPVPGAAAVNPFVPAAASTPAPAEPVQRVLDGLKSYTDWLQQVSGGMLAGAGGADSWSQSLQQMFGMFAPPASHAGGSGAHAAADPAGWWRDWMNSTSKASAGGIGAMPDWYPSFGYAREQQAQQQGIVHAALQYAETFRQYHALLLRAHGQGMALLQDKLGALDPSRPVESLKALYDLWVDCAEQAYAQIALSQEFRETYAAMVNAQMRLRKQQLSQVEQLCRELGVPTRSEVDSLGQRLQQLRREWRAAMAGAGTAAEPAPAPERSTRDDELSALRREIASLRHALGERPVVPAAKPAARRNPVARPSHSSAASKASSRTASKPVAAPKPVAAAKPAAKSVPTSRTSPTRKRR